MYDSKIDKTKIRLTPEEAEKKLRAKGFIKLPAGSYVTWIEKEWFERYKTVLSFRAGAWIPHADRLKELAVIDKEYKEYQFQKSKAEFAKRAEVKALSEAYEGQNQS